MIEILKIATLGTRSTASLPEQPSWKDWCQAASKGRTNWWAVSDLAFKIHLNVPIGQFIHAFVAPVSLILSDSIWLTWQKTFGTFWKQIYLLSDLTFWYARPMKRFELARQSIVHWSAEVHCKRNVIWEDALMSPQSLVKSLTASL